MQDHQLKSSTIEQVNAIEDDSKGAPSSSSSPTHAQPDLITADEIDHRKGGWFAYLRTRNFYIVLLLGSVLDVRF